MDQPALALPTPASAPVAAATAAAAPAPRRRKRRTPAPVAVLHPAPAPVPGAAVAPSPEGASPASPQLSLFERLDHAAAECEQVERLLGGRGMPALETIIKLHRMLILRFSLEADLAPELFELIDTLMKPVMDWARLEEKRKERELAEQKYRDQLEAEKSPREAEAAPATPKTLQPDTLEKIQDELSLL